MKNRFAGCVSVLALLAACSHVTAVDGAVRGDERAGVAPAAGPAAKGDFEWREAAPAWQADAAAALKRAYPGVQVLEDGGRVRVIYGVPMTAGGTPREAAEAWLRNHGRTFGAGVGGVLELERLWETPVRQGRFTALGYRQHLGGVPVEYGNLRILVLNEPFPRVVYAAGTLAPEPAGAAGDGEAVMEGEVARQMVRAMPLFRRMTEWGEPEAAYFQGTGEWHEPRLVWKFTGEHPDPEQMLAKTFFVDAATGDLVHVRNEIYHDVSGTVQGWATPGTLPDTGQNPPALEDVADIRVRITGAGNTYTQRDGSFVIPHAGTTPVTVGTGVSTGDALGGLWVNVVPQDGSDPLTASEQVTPPGPVDLVLNPSPSQHLTAQVNTFIHTTRTHNYFRDRAPEFNRLDVSLRANTGLNQTCNAFFRGSDPSINFYRAGGSCPNTAYSSVIAHEYGHFIVNRLNLAQGGFGEGYSDLTSMMVYDDPMIGRGFTGQGSILRNAINSNIQYPCPSSQIHTCGMILSGSWWRMRMNFGAHYGSEPGLEQIRDLQVAWSLITNGGQGTSQINSAHPITAIEVLTVDDDDGNLSNGTPNYDRICAAFAAHGIECPEVTLVEWEFPAGQPELLDPRQPTAIEVVVRGNAVEPTPESGRLVYRIGGGSFVETEMIELEPNRYLGLLPAACGERVEYYFLVGTDAGRDAEYPRFAPQVLLDVLGGVVLADLDFSSDPGWTVWNHPTLTTGHWERAVPHPSNASRQAPPAAFAGSQAWVTDNRVGDFDVDWGPTILTTGEYDLSEYTGAIVSFARWMRSVNGIPDHLVFEYSDSGGLSWTELERIGHRDDWEVAYHTLPTVSGRVQFRWIADDTPNDSITEAGVDAFRLVGCPTGACYANCTGSTTAPVLTVDDFLCFMDQFAAAQALPFAEQVAHYANCDGSTSEPVLTVDDFLCFMDEFAKGCE